MQLRDRFPSFIKYLLPFLLLLLLNTQPGARPVAEALRAARAAQGEGRHSDAAQAFRQAYTREPWRVDLVVTIGREEFAAGMIDDAARTLQSAADGGYLTADGWYELGLAYRVLGDDGAAASAWENLLGAYGPNPRVYDQLAQLYQAQRSDSAAVRMLRAWRALEPQNAQVAYRLGLLLSVIEPSEGLDLLIESARIDSSYTARVQVLRIGLRQALDSDNYAYGRLVIGRSLANISQWDLAERAFEQAAADAPQYAEAWAFLGEARYHLGLGGQAELNRAAELGPDSPVVRAITALNWRRQGEYDRALSDLETIAKQEPDEPVWQVEMGNTLAEKGDLDGARVRYEQAVALAPENSQYWEYLALFSTQYNVDIRGLGLPSARKAILLSPNDAGALDTMGVTMMALGDLSSAERFLQRALEKDASSPQVYLHLGQLYLQKQEAARARPYLRRAVEMAGENHTGEIARRLLKQYFGESSTTD